MHKSILLPLLFVAFTSLPSFGSDVDLSFDNIEEEITKKIFPDYKKIDRQTFDDLVEEVDDLMKGYRSLLTQGNLETVFNLFPTNKLLITTPLDEDNEKIMKGFQEIIGDESIEEKLEELYESFKQQKKSLQ